MSAYQTDFGQSAGLNTQDYQRLVAAAHAARSAQFAELTGLAIARIGAGLKALVTKLAEARKRRAAAARLAALDDRMLQDIGLSRSEISLAVNGIGEGFVPRLAGSGRTGAHANENVHRHAA